MKLLLFSEYKYQKSILVYIGLSNENWIMQYRRITPDV